MRVIAGTARRLSLKTIEGLETRPTTDRIKETLFNMLQPDIYDCNFLDLFSGSGGIGIEALSRGAEQAVFIEHNPKAIECIRENLEKTNLEKKAVILSCDVITGLQRLEDKGVIYDIIFMDPSYKQNDEKKVLEYLAGSKLIDNNTTIITEVSIDTSFSSVEDMGFEVVKSKEYKTNKHVFVRKKEENL